jgi:acyl transferase domain-containing protein/acyl-CoA synthetase (AMP-forming)/AMP-acid ligase II/acyl carrier protein
MSDTNSVTKSINISSVSVGDPLSLADHAPTTLREVLEQAAADKPEASLVFIADNGSEQEIYLDKLLSEATSILSGLQAQGLRPGDHLILQLDDKYEFLQVFWACILGGIIPAPIAPTVSLDPSHKTFSKFLKIYTLLNYPTLVLDDISTELGTVLRQVIDQQEGNNESHKGIVQIHSAETLRTGSEHARLHNADPESLAFLQFTSGSTGNPKGVMLSHANLVANMHSIMQCAAFTKQDISISWMPLYHDMGLIGGHLAMILSRTKTYHMRPFTFIKRPLLWLKKISEHKITATVSPNFGYKWVLEKVKDKQLQDINLNSLRLIFNGAEPISVDVMNAFLERMGNLCQLDPKSMFPVYGMAEASLAVSFPPPEELPVYSTISRSSLNIGNQVRFIDSSAKNAIRMADEGYPVTGVEIRITDNTDQLLPEEHIGHIQIKGPNVTPGYFRNTTANKEIFCEGWLRTGDLGFIRKGRLTVTGRSKDIIFINGQNFYAHDLEEIVAHQPGIDSNGIAVVGYRDEDSDEERIVLFIALEKNISSSSKKDVLKTAKPLILAVGREINEIFGFYPHFISVINRRDIPKTSSGKVQRYKLLASFHKGDFDETTLYYLTLLAGPNKVQPPVQPTQASEDMAQLLSQGSATTECEDRLRALWAESLGIPIHRISRDSSFAELGGTSIKAIEIIGKLEDQLEFSIPHYIFAKANTIATIVEYIHNYSNDSSCTTMNSTTTSQPYQQIKDSDIAIIGMSCRFPGAENSEQFWHNLSEGVDSITEVPPERWDVRKHYSRGGSEKNKSCSKWGGFLDNIRLFDADFFKIPPEEADHLDPQQRLFLEVAWETMSCGRIPTRAQNHTGVFVGASFIGYTEEFIRGGSNITIRPSTATGNLLNMIAARVSHFFDLKGPSLTLDTACSSSLAAVHLACQSLRAGECDRALAGGISLNLNETPYIFFSEAGALSPDGVCRVFDEEANGFVPGEGVGAVLLKPYQQAKEDGDNILAIIKGSALNNDGHSLGLMAPNPHSQADVIRQAYANSGVRPNQVSYIEAHGTATQIGDAIEVRSLSQVFNNIENQQCAIGSVKSNIGHLLAASGIAGLIKVVLSLQHRQITPSLHCRQEKKSIKFAQTPFFVNKSLQLWTSREAGAPLIAGINSFGFGGTNCHLIVQETPSSASPDKKDISEIHGPVLVTLSAHHQDALDQKIQYLQKFLTTNPTCPLHDISYTLNARKSHFPEHRLAIITDSKEEIMTQLESFKRSESPSRLHRRNIHYVAKKKGGPPRTVFMFSGQGAQFTAMGKVLYENEPMFRDAVDLCQELIVPYFDHNLVELICGDLPQEELNRTAITQPITFVMDLALAMFWQGLGLKPAAVIGHSVGEYVAAVIAGIVSLEDALKMVVVRGRLMSQLPAGGGMAAIFAPEEDVQKILSQGYQLDIAAFNGPENIVLSGNIKELDRCIEALKVQNINAFKLQVSHAFHSTAIEPMLAPFSKVLAGISFHEPIIPFSSNLTGKLVTGAEVNREYWLRHVRQPVNFVKGIKSLCNKGYRDFLEIGARDQLTVLASKIVPQKTRVRSSLPNPRKNPDQYKHLLGIFGEMYTRGFVPDWRDHYEGKAGNKLLQFPNYPFQRQEHWISQDQAVYPFESMIKKTGPDRFSITLNKKSPLLGNYVFNGLPVMPAAGQCELLLSCFSRTYGYTANRIRSIAFSGPWTINKSMDILFKKKGNEKNFRVITGKMRRTSDKKPNIFTSGTLGVLETNVPDRIDVETIISRCPRVFESGTLYADFKEIGLHYGPYFQNLKKVYGGDQEALAELSLDQATSADAVCILHPGLLDSVFQAVGCCISGAQAFLPLAIKDLIIHRRPELTGSFAHIRRLDSKNDDLINFNIELVNQTGEICVEIKEFSVIRMKEQQKQTEFNLFALNWQEQQLPMEEQTADQGCWLLFGSETGTGIRIKESLQEKGITVIDPSWSSETFAEFSENDYLALFEKLTTENITLTGIIHCGDCTSGSDQSEFTTMKDLSPSVHKLFILFKVLEKSSFHNLPFFRISTNAQIIHENEKITNLAKTLSTGFLHTMHQERNGIHIRNVDFSTEHSNSVIASLTLAELNHSSPFETAYRAGKRYVRTLRVWHTDTESPPEFKFSEDHVYWITGGLHGAGAECAAHLVNHGVTRLVITDNITLPPEDQHESCIRNENSERTAGLILTRQLEAAGCQILYLEGDVSDPESMLNHYNLIKQKWGIIHGVIHAASPLKNGSDKQQSWPTFEQTLTPGVMGTILLNRLTQQEPLEFFVLFSSIPGLSMNLGQGESGAAHCFMDNFIKKENRPGPGRGRSVQWGQWALETQLDPQVHQFMERNRLSPILSGEGMQAFDMILAQDKTDSLAFLPHRTGSDATIAHNLNALRESSNEIIQTRKDDRKKPSPEPKTDQQVKQPTENSEISLQQYLINLAADKLKLTPEELDPDINFLELGADSMIAIGLIRDLEEKLDIKLYPTLLFEYPTINGLTGYLQTHLPDHADLSALALPADMIKAKTVPAAQQICAKKQQAPQKTAASIEQDGLLGYITQLAANKLEIAKEELDPSVNFLELGADSMVAIGLIREVEEALNIELYPTLLFEYPTINDFVGYLQKNMPTEQIVKTTRKSCSTTAEKQTVHKTICSAKPAADEDPVTSAVTRLLAKQQEWFDTQFQIQRDEIARLRLLIKQNSKPSS